MGKSQREKGKRGERELAGILRAHGYGARRGQQFCGADGSADVIGLSGIHIECKRVERLNLQDAYGQAKRRCQGRRVPCGVSPEGSSALDGYNGPGGLSGDLSGMGNRSGNEGQVSAYVNYIVEIKRI